MSKYGQIIDNIRAALIPKTYTSGGDWVEDNIILQGVGEPYAGAVDLGLNPYLRYCLDRASLRDTTDVTLVAGTQMGKTLFLRCFAFLLIATQGQNQLWAYPNTTLARSFSESRLLPLIDSSPTLSALKTGNRHDLAKLSIKLSTGQIDLVGSYSDANLMSRSCRYAFIDEANALRDPLAIKLILERTKAFRVGKRHKHIMASTPTIEEDEAIWDSYLQGSMTKVLVKSPHSPESSPFELTTKHLKCSPECKKDGLYIWELVASTTFAECPHTGKPITQEQKPWMLRNAVYVDTNKHAEPGHFSIHLPTILSPFVSWGDYLVEFLKSRGNAYKLESFTNNYEALPWCEINIDGADQNLATNGAAGTHKRTDNLEGIPLMAVDCQGGDVYKWQVNKIIGKKTWAQDWGEVVGFKNLDAIWDKYRPYKTLVDNGWGEKHAYIMGEVFARKEQGWVTIKGDDTLSGDKPFLSTRVDPFRGTQKSKKHTIQNITINHKLAKPEVFFARSGQDENYKWPFDVDPEYSREVFNEIQKREPTKNGQSRLVYKKIGTNDYFDINNYLIAGAKYFKIHDMKTYVAPEPKKEEAEPEDITQVEVIPKRKWEHKGHTLTFSQ